MKVLLIRFITRENKGSVGHVPRRALLLLLVHIEGRVA